VGGFRASLSTEAGKLARIDFGQVKAQGIRDRTIGGPSPQAVIWLTNTVQVFCVEIFAEVVAAMRQGGGQVLPYRELMYWVKSES